MSVQLSGLNRRIAAARNAGPAARTAALRVLTGDVVRNVLRPAPVGVVRDTQRMARGFAMANNAAGLPALPVPGVTPSRRAAAHLAKLREQARRAARQVERWTRYQQSYIDKRRTGQRYYRVILARLDPDRRGSPAWRLRRALEEAAKYADALRMGFAPLIIGNVGRSIRWTTRDRLYGGTGRTVQYADVTLVEIRNKEPHAIIQERLRRTVRGHLNASRRRGGVRLSRARRAYLDALRRLNRA